PIDHAGQMNLRFDVALLRRAPQPVTRRVVARRRFLGLLEHQADSELRPGIAVFRRLQPRARLEVEAAGLVSPRDGSLRTEPAPKAGLVAHLWHAPSGL